MKSPTAWWPSQTCVYQSTETFLNRHLQPDLIQTLECVEPPINRIPYCSRTTSWKWLGWLASAHMDEFEEISSFGVLLKHLNIPSMAVVGPRLVFRTDDTNYNSLGSLGRLTLNYQTLWGLRLRSPTKVLNLFGWVSRASKRLNCFNLPIVHLKWSSGEKIPHTGDTTSLDRCG